MPIGGMLIRTHYSSVEITPLLIISYNEEVLFTGFHLCLSDQFKQEARPHERIKSFF